MARRNKRNSKKDETLVDLGQATENAQDFFERNQNLVLGALAAVVILVGGYLAYSNFVLKPKMEEAASQMTVAQNQFEKDSFALALSNPGGGFEGFLGIIDNYSGTPSANLAHYYAGVCYLHLGDYNTAIEYLENFDPEGEVMPIMKAGVIGDAYSELKQLDKAESQYKKAVDAGDNDMLTAFYLKKLAEIREYQGNTAAALETYKELKRRYPESQEARNIEKFITRLEQ